MRELAAVVLAFIAAVRPPDPVRAGLLVTASAHSVVAMAGPALAPGAALTVVTPEDPQRVQRAVVVRRVPDSEELARHTVPGPYYEVTSDSSSSALPDLAIAVLGRAAVEQIGTAVALRLGTPPVTIRARSCTSSEGLHVTLWNGKPLEATRLWHAYYYLGYDVAPTCRPADYREGSQSDPRRR
jgi:hypothetical protein